MRRYTRKKDTLENISASFIDAESVVDSAISRMEIVLSSVRYPIKFGSRRHLEMKSYLPYAIHPTEKEGTRILLNRHYKPVGYPDSDGWVVYEDIENMHVQLNEKQVSEIVRTKMWGGWFYKDVIAPWRDKQSAKAYLGALHRLRQFISV